MKNDKIIKVCNEAQYRYLEKVIGDKLSDAFKQEYEQYNKFLLETGISVLPDGLYKNGEKLDYGDVRRLYDKFGERNKKTDEKHILQTQKETYSNLHNIKTI